MNDETTGTQNGITAGGRGGTMDSDQKCGVFASSVSRNARYSAVFEDDGNVAYAYLLCDKKIIGDVWLYNDGDAPLTRPWIDRSKRPPFANPSEFALRGQFAVVKIPDEVSFAWLYNDDNSSIAAVEIWIRGDIHARIAPGSKPGWCRMAAKDGPLALALR